MSSVLPFPVAVALLSSVFGDGLSTREGQLYFTLMGLMLIPNIIAYFLLYGVAALRNRDPQNSPWSKRLAGTVGVVAFTAVACWGLWAGVANRQFHDIQELATIFALPLLPALLVLGAVRLSAIQRP